MNKIIKFHPDMKSIWDTFVAEGKNSHFMFKRDYMDYHSDRFQDHSLLFYDHSVLVAVLPASLQDDLLVSHGGLTFGGMVIHKKVKATQVLDFFAQLKLYLHTQKIRALRYKAIPYIYHDIPAEEDLYALFINNANLVRRDISSTICLQNPIGFSGGKKNGLAKAKKAGLSIAETQDYDVFYQMLNRILDEKYDTRATHSAAEMIRLSEMFPENIQLIGAFHGDEMLAGAILFVAGQVVHTQYLATTEQGRDCGALDFLLYVLINDTYASKRYFDFGISTEKQGRYLNTGLISQKEMFGARAVVYDTYEWMLES